MKLTRNSLRNSVLRSLCIIVFLGVVISVLSFFDLGGRKEKVDLLEHCPEDVIKQNERPSCKNIAQLGYKK